MSGVKVSIVIATYNRVESLKTCLDSLELQEFDRNLFEVIVVNDGSTDSTALYLGQFKNRTLLNFKYVSHNNKGVSASRNAGIEIAEGEFIAFTDDDCILPPDWLTRIYQDLQRTSPAIAGIGGPLDCQKGELRNFLSDFINYLDEFNYIPVMGRFWIVPVHITKLKDTDKPVYIRTSNAVFKKKCLKEAGCFDDNFKRPGGEDPDLCYRLLNLNYSFYFDRDLKVIHRPRISFGSYFASIRNYIIGELKKSGKKRLYRNRIVQRSYEQLFIKKLVACGLSIISLPSTFLNLAFQSKYTFFEKITFPFLVSISKTYAVTVYVYYRLLGRPM